METADESGKAKQAEREELPVFHFLRTTPLDMAGRPPLASSLQSLETCLLMLALGRYPSALVTCAAAWESAMRAELGLKIGDSTELWSLIEQVRQRSATLRTYRPEKLTEFRQTRNRIMHDGFSPRDDKECARLLLETGFPFLKQLYRQLFDFCLDWRDVRPGVTAWDQLKAKELEKAGLAFEVADWLRLALEVYRKAKDIQGLNFSYCFLPLNHLIWQSMKNAALSDVEDQLLNDQDASWDLEHKRTEEYRIHLDGAWFFNCPLCRGFGTFMGEVGWDALQQGRLHLERCHCVRCDFRIPAHAPFLADLMMGDRLAAEAEKIKQAFGVSPRV